MSDECRMDALRVWNASSEQDASLPEDAYEMLDRATALRRASVGGPEWPVARLAEGLARFLIARQMADWGHRSYTIQALEASLDALRDAAASLPETFVPSPAEVLNFRQNLHRAWRDAQSDPDLSRISGLTIAALRLSVPAPKA